MLRIRHFFQPISHQFGSRSYHSIANIINTHKPISYRTKEEIDISKSLKFNNVLQYIQQNPIKKRSIQPKIKNLRRYLGNDTNISDELLCVAMHPFDEQHIQIKIEGKPTLIDMDSIEKTGGQLYRLQSSLFLVDKFHQSYGIDILQTELSTQFTRTSTLNAYLLRNNLLKIPKMGSNHNKHLHIVKAKRILFRLIGLINLLKGKKSASDFIHKNVCNDIFESILSKRR